MHVLGLSELGRRAQKVVRDDARAADWLAIEENGALQIMQVLVPHEAKTWEAYYSPWARIVPTGAHAQFRLEHIALSGKWQVLDVEGSLEYCVRQILDNKYHLFFG